MPASKTSPKRSLQLAILLIVQQILILQRLPASRRCNVELFGQIVDLRLELIVDGLDLAIGLDAAVVRLVARSCRACSVVSRIVGRQRVAI